MKKLFNLPKLLGLITLTIMLSSCAFLEHRDFESEMSDFRMDDPMFIPNQDFAVVPGDSGMYHRSDDIISSRTPATAESRDRQIYNESLRRELRGLENRLTDSEYSDYIKYRNQIGGESERIYFLRLSKSERIDYLSSRGISVPRYYTVTENKMAAYSNEVVLGMQKNEVIRSWGQPVRREVSGDPRYENERWAFRRNGAVSYIYFSGGVVEGWSNP